jgi:hypothetical protein
MGKFVLLAPFEGEAREVGYNAVYAVRLALQDAQSPFILLSLDDGGRLDYTLERARALHYDPSVQAVLVLGEHATSPQTLSALAGQKVFVVPRDDAPLADEAFRARFLASALYPPPPTMTAYHAYTVALEALRAK